RIARRNLDDFCGTEAIKTRLQRIWLTQTLDAGTRGHADHQVISQHLRAQLLVMLPQGAAEILDHRRGHHWHARQHAGQTIAKHGQSPQERDGKTPCTAMQARSTTYGCRFSTGWLLPNASVLPPSAALPVSSATLSSGAAGASL